MLYFLFFFPGVLALVIAGWGYAHESFAIQEVSVNSPVGVPIWPLKMLIPAAGVLLTLQGIAEVLRCVLCLQRRRVAGAAARRRGARDSQLLARSGAARRRDEGGRHEQSRSSPC